ncbi:MAG: ribosome silencing factor [Elusimicrobia bacterium RIFCSPLOWO2_01_FULL_54_10]|nr:MAG: ribosome silencing factor [Elusimicrobia bacterium RIFCSPLOWO2_01_FULL_54_10]
MSADSKQGAEISVLDIRKAPGGPSDYMLLMSANSHVHMKTLRDSIEESLEGYGLTSIHRDGSRDSKWMALDYGGLLIHIFLEEVRDFYSLERLWPEARTLAWEPQKTKVPSRKRRKS